MDYLSPCILHINDPVTKDDGKLCCMSDTNVYHEDDAIANYVLTGISNDTYFMNDHMLVYL